MKRKIYLIIIVILMFVLSACKKEKKIYYNFNKVVDYLYEITYDDYLYDYNLDTVVNVEKFGCSSVRNGNFYGRNFDFVFNDIPEFIVRVNANKDRHASIGVTTISGIHDSDDIETKHADLLKLIPNFMLDGINDSGVICSDNVVPKKDTLPITGTNPGKENLHIGLIVRFVLDNASSADEAISLLQNKNIYGDVGDTYNLHFMIADKEKTYVVEFLDNKIVVSEKTGNNQIMTNYYVNLNEITENAAGVERYQILKDNYREGYSFEGMYNLMRRVQFSKAYLFDNEKEWYSDFLPQSMIKTLNDETNSIDDYVENLKKEYWVARGLDQRNPSNHAYWITTHNSIYDINERKLRVTVQENYKKFFEYNL